MLDPKSTVMIEDARIVFRNFAGREGPMNREGDRNFGVLLEPGLAEAMLRDGWNVKYLKGREEGDADQPYIGVSVKYGKGRPPRVVTLTSRGRTELGEDEVEMLDWAEYKNVDLIFRPYNWNVGDKTGVKAYLKEIFVTLNESELDLKYSNIPEAKEPTPYERDELTERA